MTTLQISATAGATAAAATYAPSEIGIICAVIGAALSVWAAAARSELTMRAAFGLLGQFATSVAVGIGGSAAMQVMAPHFGVTAAIAALPEWILSLALAGGAQMILPMIAAILRRKSDAV